jgi:flagellar basal body-associated protein FliL
MELIIIAIIALGIAVFISYTFLKTPDDEKTHPLDSATNKYTGEPVSTYVEPPQPVVEEKPIVVDTVDAKIAPSAPAESVKQPTTQEKPRKKYYKPKANTNANKQSGKKPAPNTGQPKKPAIKK